MPFVFKQLVVCKCDFIFKLCLKNVTVKNTLGVIL